MKSTLKVMRYVVARFNGAGPLVNAIVENSGGTGVQADLGGSLSLVGSVVRNSGGNGVHGAGGHVVLLGGTVIQNSGFNGIQASGGGSVAIFDATVENSAGGGVNAHTAGAILLGAGSLIRANTHAGALAIINGALFMTDGARVAENLGDGVLAARGGYCHHGEGRDRRKQRRQRGYGLIRGFAVHWRRKHYPGEQQPRHPPQECQRGGARAA